MKTQKMLVMGALVCLMAFFNVSIFAQTAQAQQADPAVVMPRFVAQTLRAAGLDVRRDGDVLIVEEQIKLLVPSTLQDWEESGIRARLLEDSRSQFSLFRPLETDDPADELLRFAQFQQFAQADSDDLLLFAQFKQCLDTADFINKVRYNVCGVGANSASNLFCKTGVLLDHVGDSLNCIFTYLCTPENNFCT